MTLDTNSGNGAEETHVTTSYENNPHELLFGMNRQMLGNDPDTCPISTSTSPSDPNSLNAFFQSIVHTSNNIFQPQPIVASSYHQLLHLPNEAPLQSSSFEQPTAASFASAHASPQSSSSIFENESFQAVHLPFEYLPLGAAASSLTDPIHIHSMANNSSLYMSSYYPSLSSHNLTSGQAPESRPSTTSTSNAQERLQSASSAVSILGSSQSPQGHDRNMQCHLQGQNKDQKLTEETQPAGDLDLAFSSCALVDTSSVAESTLVHSLSPSRSNKRTHSVATASAGASQLKSSTLSESNHVGRPSSRNQPKTSKLSMVNSFSQNSPKIKLKNLKRNRPEKIYTQQSLKSRPDQLTTPSRNILANKKINSNILPPTPDSLQRPKNQCSTSRDDLDNPGEPSQKKKQKIEAIERALEALDTLTEYLSQEANECTSNNDDPAEYQNQLSPNQQHCNLNLSLVSPQHFFTLGELGGRLRRRLDVQRR